MLPDSLRNIELNQERMAAIEGQLTSGSRISKPSDDPVGAARAIGFQQSIDQSNQYLKNIDQGTNWLNSTDAALGSVTADLQRARELAVQAANGTLSPADKHAIQLEVTQLQQSVLDLSNSKVGSSYCSRARKSDKPGYLQAVSSQLTPVGVQGQRGLGPARSLAWRHRRRECRRAVDVRSDLQGAGPDSGRTGSTRRLRPRLQPPRLSPAARRRWPSAPGGR